MPLRLMTRFRPLGVIRSPRRGRIPLRLKGVLASFRGNSPSLWGRGGRVPQAALTGMGFWMGFWRDFSYLFPVTFTFLTQKYCCDVPE